jgi:FtsP/CotA-like multicopper oxidase with cupredoxin domain
MPKSKLSIEFYANNPGKWFWHCHNLYHLASGMAREVHYVV